MKLLVSFSLMLCDPVGWDLAPDPTPPPGRVGCTEAHGLADRRHTSGESAVSLRSRSCFCGQFPPLGREDETPPMSRGCWGMQSTETSACGQLSLLWRDIGLFLWPLPHLNDKPRRTGRPGHTVVRALHVCVGKRAGYGRLPNHTVCPEEVCRGGYMQAGTFR